MASASGDTTLLGGSGNDNLIGGAGGAVVGVIVALVVRMGMGSRGES